jgi:hypothetical protein
MINHLIIGLISLFFVLIGGQISRPNILSLSASEKLSLHSVVSRALLNPFCDGFTVNLVCIVYFIVPLKAVSENLSDSSWFEWLLLIKRCQREF